MLLQRQRQRTRPARRRGQALVEFAIVVPLFLLLVAGMIDFGLGLNASITVSNAAREGARSGAVNPVATGPGSIAEKVQAMTQGTLPGSVTVNATCTHADLGAGACTLTGTTPATDAVMGDTVIVTVDFDYHMIWPLAFGNTIHLASTARFRVE